MEYSVFCHLTERRNSLTAIELENATACADHLTVVNALGIEDWEDPEEWEAVLDCYDERFLWDLDYQDEQGLDLPPEREAATREVMGIANEYYTSIPPDLGVEETLQGGTKRVALAIDHVAT